MKIAVAIATTGRPNVVAQTLLRLARQTRAPDHVLVIGAAEADLPSRKASGGVQFILGGRGSSKQRNRALDLLEAEFEIVIFFDDDFVPARDFIAGVEHLMTAHPDVVAASGHLLADGFRSAGISIAEADDLIFAYERDALEAPYVIDQPGAYGCNMVIRRAALPQARFDENLPLYGWLEDLDFSASFARVGRIVKTNLCVGVHLGIKTGRSPGLQLGYSQIANPLYLAAKRTMPRRRAVTMACKNVIANSIRSLAPESYIDRRGRLRGNLLAIGDIIHRRAHPMRILDLNSLPRSQSVEQVML
ncbi:MAG: glycosyltransferase family 2 protein [Methylovirgula sp.]